tara:strand:- start:5148 stop:5783 length:636 start_codon:yes stop_codon:yes gene_type:complete
MARKKPTRRSRKKLSPKSENQSDYIRDISECDITFCHGPAGSGKTAIAVGLACEYLMDQKIEKIVVTRPVVESGGGLGYLPGTMEEKIQPYLVPIMEEMKLYLPKAILESESVELCPLEYMRGRNFHHSFMILDEAQNATLDQIKMFVTRIGWGSKAVINGDLEQTDLGEATGLEGCLDKLEGLAGIGICELTDDDIVRNDIISKILRRLQ